ncbi:MAG: hypothetical protein KatS3mg103_0660 [Phycisphaerales bacterium]|nr:MAG: hypothetical protein KatS3mg103_0660 [Phycisphaerales bacterium]
MRHTDIDANQIEAMREACDRLPSNLFVLTSAYDQLRAGTLVVGVHRCATEPLLLSVPVRRGHPINPLIRDSRAFAVCSIDPQDRAMRRRFAFHPSAEERHDPFDALAVLSLRTGSPILRSSALAFDCEVLRHVDMEADHELYIGRVVAVRVAGEPPPALRASQIGPLHED